MGYFGKNKVVFVQIMAGAREKLAVFLMVIGLAVALAQPSVAQTSLEAKVLKAYGYDDDGVLAQKLSDVSKVTGGLMCGSAMTKKACRSTQEHFISELTGDLPKVRGDLLRYLEQTGGLRRALGNAGPKDRTVHNCAGEAIQSCKVLVDFFFRGGIIDQLKEARQKAAHDVKPFYKDGRPFDG